MATTMVALTFCDVCEEPAVGLTPARYHQGVNVCAACLEGELDIIAHSEPDDDDD